MRTPMFAVVLVAALVSARPAEAQSYSPDPRTPLVSATGSGEISRPPDYVVVAVGLLAHGSSPGGTSAELDRLLGEVRDSLRARALPDSSVIVGVRTIEPQRTFPERQITGYTVGISLKVILRDLAKLNQVLDALAGAGATEIPEVKFKSDQEDSAYDAALAAAVTEATRRAAAAARAAGGRLGPIVMIDLGGRFGFDPDDIEYTRMEAPRTQGSTATAHATVTIYWRFDGR